jgi:hypothetical protein
LRKQAVFLKGWRPALYCSYGSRLIAGAALLHVALTVGLFAVGRAQIAPSLVDRDGIMGSVTHDSYNYRREALGLPLVNESDPGEEPEQTRQAHTKVLSLEFAIFGRLFGYTILSAEPFNLLCYVAILSLVMMLGREIGNRRIALVAVGVVAVWPTFLLHSTQFLKDPFFIAIALALILIVTTWLTRTYTWREAVISGAALSVTAGLLLLIRVKFAGFIFAIVCFGFMCLIIRQLLERRLLYRNLICPVLILTATVPAAFYLAATSNQAFKRYPSDQSGVNKLYVPVAQLPTVIYRERTSLKTTPSRYAKLSGLADQALRGIAAARFDFNHSYPGSASLIDNDVYFNSFIDLLRYLPRAFAIGLWAPFPDMWVGAGTHVGSAGRLSSGAETLFMYLCELLALVALWRAPRCLANWLMLSIYTLGVTALGLIVSNVGALYRLRYLFVILLIILAVKGLESIVTNRSRERSVPPEGNPPNNPLRGEAGTQKAVRRLAFIVMLVCVVAATWVSFGSSAVAPRASSAMLDFTLINRTRSTIQGIYISPHDSPGWEENVLGEGKLPNGQMVTIRFRTDEQSAMWDLRVEIKHRGSADWKNLSLREISRMILRVSDDRNLFLAEIE